MNKKKLFIKIDQPASLRLSLNYSCSILNYQSEIYNTNDPILKLLEKLEDIKQIIDGNKIAKISKYLYFNKKFIQEILYEDNEVLDIKYNKYNNNLEFFFYLNLLIRENPDIYNYNFDIEYIVEFNNENKTKTEKKLNQVIKAKLIIELSNEYLLDNDCYDSDKGKELDEIIKENLNIIENNISIFEVINKNLNMNNIIDISIDKLYVQIIIGLIETNKFENFNYAYDIICQLNLEEIDITKSMYDNIKQFLDNEKNQKILNTYVIKEENDLNNESKVNFNFILINYILKNIYNIYDIKFISNLRENLKKILDNNKNALKSIENNKYSRIKSILDLLSLEPKKHLKNNLKSYYNKFQTDNSKHKKIQKTVNEEKDGKEHGLLFLVDYVYQIFDIEEFREIYISIISQKEKDYSSLLDYLAISNDNYNEKLKKILKNEELEKVLNNPDKKLNENNLKNLFIFESPNDDEILNKIENKIALLDKPNELACEEEAINNFNEYMGKGNDENENYNDIYE